MDFGAVGLDGLVVGFSSTTTTPSLDPEAKQRPYGSGFFKAERSSGFDDEWRSSKLAKTDDFSAPKAMQRSTITSLRSHTSLFSDAQQNQHMLCFSSPKSDAALPYLNYQSPSAHSNYAGFNFGSLSAASMRGVMGGSRGPFTPSQWMELEHQALIYKYINANVPVPSNLLIPIKKAFESAGLSCYPGGLLRHNSLGWGSFHLGFSSSTDPEPGRCRRTDGKKWRCSRDAVADQKYCERHMNRGRHRSRKPVEGQNGHPVSGATTTTTTKQSTTSLLPSVASSPSVVPAGGPSSISYNATAAHHLQPSGLSLSADNTINRFSMNKENVTEKLQDQPGSFSMSSPHVDLKPKENSFLMMKQNLPYDDSSRLNFGTDGSGSVLNFRNLGTLKELTDRDTDSQHSSVHQFMNDERTHLSISIPMASSDLIPSTSSSNQDKLTLSPLNLAGGSVMNEPLHRQTNWIPISWENSMGGPLGEVLHNASNNNSCSTDCMTSSGLNLMTDGWDSSSPLGSSPTGVLHESTFESVSNSSAGSSPRAAAEDIRKQLE